MGGIAVIDRFKIFIKNIPSYPSLIEIADDIAKVLDEHKINQTIFLGEGVGADICIIMAINYSNVCNGLCLIRPNGSTVSLNEQLAYIANSLDATRSRIADEILFAYLVWHRFGIKANDTRNIQIFVSFIYLIHDSDSIYF